MKKKSEPANAPSHQQALSNQGKKSKVQTGPKKGTKETKEIRESRQQQVDKIDKNKGSLRESTTQPVAAELEKSALLE